MWPVVVAKADSEADSEADLEGEVVEVVEDDDQVEVVTVEPHPPHHQ